MEFLIYIEEYCAIAYAEFKSVPKSMLLFNLCKAVIFLCARNEQIHADGVGSISHL